MSTPIEEKKSAILIAVVPQIENGAHSKYKDSYKFIATFNNGDTGVCFGKNQVAQWELNKSYNYTKKTGSSQNGTWVNIYFEKPQDQDQGGQTSSGGRGGEDFRKGKAERITEMKVQCLVACCNLFQGSGKPDEDFKDSYKELITLAGLDEMTDGSQPAPKKKEFTETTKNSMIEYLSSNEVSKIVSVVVSIKDYEIDQPTLIEMFGKLVRPF